MSEKVGRNDPCPCGSGKKYKNCCFLEEQKKSKTSSLSGKRKFTAKLISGGGVKPQEPTQSTEQAVVDYNTLMERSFGAAIHSTDEKPPLPSNPNQYLSQEKQNTRQEE
jgi:uncharacterized protein